LKSTEFASNNSHGDNAHQMVKQWMDRDGWTDGLSFYSVLKKKE